MTRSITLKFARARQPLDRYIAYLSYGAVGMGVGSLLLMVGLITLNVILRYAFKSPLIFTEEYAAYLFVLVVYMGLAYCARVEAHLTVDLVYKRLPTKLRYGLDIATTILSLMVVGLFFRSYLYLFVRSILDHQIALTSIRTPLAIPQAFLIIGLLLLALELAAILVKKTLAFRKID